MAKLVCAATGVVVDVKDEKVIERMKAQGFTEKTQQPKTQPAKAKAKKKD